MQYVHPNLCRILVTLLRISLSPQKLNSSPCYNVSYQVSLIACTWSLHVVPHPPVRSPDGWLLQTIIINSWPR